MFKNRCVLIVDGDEDSRDTVESFLRGLGVYAVGAATAAEALTAVQLVRIDAVIVDIRLADASAATLIGWLRAAGYDVPTLGLVQRVDEAASASALEACDAHVSKPVDFRRMERILRLLLPPPLQKNVPAGPPAVRWGHA